MNKDKSPIDSFSVSLGQSSSAGPVSPEQQLQPWNILICSDFGFRSVKPQPVRIAEWNEFMASANVVLSGTVENMLSPSRRPIFVEYNVTSMKDFSPEIMRTKIQAFSGYAVLLDTLACFIQGKTTRENALSAVQQASLPQEEKERLLNIFGLHNAPPEPRFDASPKKSAVASILSMVDIADTSADDPKAPHTALSGLLTSLSESKGSIKDKKECAAYLEAGNAMFNLQLSALQAQPFFAMKRASWECLMRCVKAIGRKKEIRLSVFSAPPDAGDEVFEILSAVVGSSDVPPDIILWDYPILFTNAEMTRLTRLTGVADRLKSAVIAPLSPADQLFENIDKRHDFSPLFEDIRFLPFKKLRSSLPSRALCLCAPDMTIPDAAIGRDTPRVRVSFRAHCCWPMILRWIEKSLCDIDPFALDSSGNAADTMLPENAQFDQNIPQSFCQEAASVAGITLYNGTPFEATIPKARTVIDPEVAGSAYSSFAFNLLVNRVARLAGLRIVQNASSMKGNELARDIEGFLAKELISYRVCTAPDQVSVKSGQDGSLDISLNSEVMVGGFPARFSFSLEA